MIRVNIIIFVIYVIYNSSIQYMLYNYISEFICVLLFIVYKFSHLTYFVLTLNCVYYFYLLQFDLLLLKGDSYVRNMLF